MPRRGGVPKREVIIDPIYNSTVVTKLINTCLTKFLSLNTILNLINSVYPCCPWQWSQS